MITVKPRPITDTIPGTERPAVAGGAATPLNTIPFADGSPWRIQDFADYSKSNKSKPWCSWSTFVTMPIGII